MTLLRPQRRRRQTETPEDRLDVLEQQYDSLATEVALGSSAHAKLAETVNALRLSVDQLQVTTKEQASAIRDVVTNTQAGRELLSKMLDEIVTKKTSGWLVVAIPAAILAAPQWMPWVWKILAAMFPHV